MSKDIDNTTVKGCSELIVAFVLSLLVCFVITCCVGCKPHKEVVTEYVEQPVVVTQEHHTESVRVDIVRDTIHQRDSIYHYINGDTTIIERWHYYTNNNNAVRIDTLIKVDSVQVPVVTERVVTEVQAVEKPLKWWQRALMMLGGVMLVGTGLTLAHWLGKRYKM